MEQKLAPVFKALGDSNRLKIVLLLSKGEMCACDILEMFEFSQPTLSHHMKILCDCACVNARKDGKWSYYSINSEIFRDIQNFLNVFVSDSVF